MVCLLSGRVSRLARGLLPSFLPSFLLILLVGMGGAGDSAADQHVIVSFVNKADKAFGANGDFVFTSLDSCKYGSVKGILSNTGFKWGRQLWHTPDACLTNIYWLVFSDSDDVKSICTDLEADPSVDYATESGTVGPLADPYVIEPNDYWYNHSFRWELNHHHEGCDDPQYLPIEHYRQWYLPLLGLERAWAITTGDSSVVVAIIDSGFDLNHPDLRDVLWWNQAELNGIDGVDDDGNGFVDDKCGWDFGSAVYDTTDSTFVTVGDNDVTVEPHWWQRIGCASSSDCDSCSCVDSGCDPEHCVPEYWGAERHGLAMAGIISASSNDSAGVAGINWKTKILPIKIGPNHLTKPRLDVSDSTLWPNMIEAINYVCEMKANTGAGPPDIRVLNMSLTFDRAGFENPRPNPEPVFSPMFDRLRECGVLPVGGSGNFATVHDTLGEYHHLHPVYPCRDPDVLCTSAVRFNREKWDSAQYGYWENTSPEMGVDLCGYVSEETWCGINADPFGGNCGEADTMKYMPQPMILGYEQEVGAFWSFCNDVSHPGQVFEDGNHHIYGVSPLMTSGTTAQASGVAALLFSVYPQLTVDQAEAMLLRGCVNVDAENPTLNPGDLGAGVMDAYRTLTLWGTVSTDTTLSGEVWVSDNVTFTGDLTILPGTVIHVAPWGYMDPNHYIEITISSGNIQILGSESDPVVIAGWVESWDVFQDVCWEGVTIEQCQAGSKIQNLVLKHATVGIDLIGCHDLEISHSVVDSTSVGIVVAGGCTGVSLTDVSVRRAEAGLLVYGGADLQDVVIGNCRQYGMIVYGTGQPFVVPGTVQIHDVTGTGLKFDGSGTSLTLSGVSISNCTDDAVYCDGRTVTLHDFTVQYCGTGIEAANAGLVSVRDLSLEGNGGIGLNMGATGTIDAGTETDHGHNAFDGALTYYAVNGNEQVTLQMVGNCYNGRATPKDSSKFVGTGTIEYQPGDCQ